jgi:hypothetical protein
VEALAVSKITYKNLQPLHLLSRTLLFTVNTVTRRAVPLVPLDRIGTSVYALRLEIHK